MRPPFSSALLIPLLTGLASAQALPAPPPTAREEVTDDYHGTPITDPFRWLEGDEKGELTDRVGAWTDAQNAYTRKILDELPGRAAVEARLKELMTVGRVGAPVQRRNRYFYRARRGDQNQSPLYLREGREGKARTLIDPNALDEKGLISLDWFSPSHDGELLAFGLSRAGDENTTLHVLEVSSGKWLADTIPNKVGGADWLPGGKAFFYSPLGDVKDPYSRKIRYHVLGTHPREDKTLYEQHSTTWGPFAYPCPQGRWLILGYFTSTRTNDLWVCDLDAWHATGKLVKTVISEGPDAQGYGPVEGDTLFLRTTEGASNGQVLAINLHDPKDRRVLIPERKDFVIRSVDLARGMLVVTGLCKACSRIERYSLDGKALGVVELPGIGSASISVERDRLEAYLSFTSYNTPRSVYRLDLGTNERSLWARAEVKVDPSTVEVRQVSYPSKDGTSVTMFLVHKKGLTLDGNNPTLLYGYGGFRIPLTPGFRSTLFPWFEAGGVYAVANLRGGGEYGDAWHKAGTLGNKQNVFDDFIAAAEYLIKTKVTRPERLAIAGGSNGGLLTGAVMVQRPKLFRAVISSVPLLDMLRYQRFLMARFWVPEYGSAEKKEQFDFLRAYSPYHNVKKGVAYPALFLKAGENDSRVHPLHARKFAALVQSATSGDRPVLLWVDRQAGHGQGKPLALRIRDAADQRMFLLWQLGMLKPQ
ncbi:MAG: S9 family peptidase [Planctomycetes bacterium]|nr:S9 family peptidase [Planctomycetota bacterium]